LLKTKAEEFTVLFQIIGAFWFIVILRRLSFSQMYFG
jgi:hypothetical protein